MNLTDFIELAKMNEEAKQDYDILGADYSQKDGCYAVQVYSNSFKDLAAGKQVKFDSYGENFRLSFQYQGAKFYCVINMEQYENEFKEWLSLPFTDEEFITTPKGVSSSELSMKHAGMSMKDFQ